MKKTKRLISLLMAFAMIITMVSSGLTALASISVSNSPVTVSAIVPELIYLTPGAKTFQYYIAGAANGTAPSMTKGTSGTITFTCSSTASSISLATTGAAAITISNTSATNTNTLTANITAGSMASVASGFIKYTFTYVVDGVTYKTYAGTYVYSPYLGQVGAEFGYVYKTSTGNEPKLAAYSFLVGVHAATGGAYNSTFVTAANDYTKSPLVPGWGSANIPIAADNAEIDPAYYPDNASLTGGVASRGRDRTDSKSMTRGDYGVYGTLTIDPSRYTSGSALNLIPNFWGGWMIHYSAKSSDTHKLTHFKSTDGSITIASEVNYISGTDGQAFNNYAPGGAVPSTSTRYNMETRFQFERSSSSCVSLYLQYGLQINLVDKATLRSTVNGAISTNYQEADYTAASWATYSTALLNGISILGNPAAAATDVTAAVTAINNAISGLVKNQYTCTIYHKLPAVDGFQYSYNGNSYTAADGYITIVETKSFDSNSKVTVGTNSYSGYSYNATSAKPASVTYNHSRANVTHTFVYTALTSIIYFQNESVHNAYVTNATTSMTVTYAQPYGTFPTPKMDGWRFTGWYDGSNTKVLGTTVCTMITSSLTLTSKWTCYFGSGHGSSADPFVISTIAHLDSIDDTSVIVSSAGKYFKQTADIPYTITYSAVRTFSGNYDGQNYSITTAAANTIADATYANIFGAVTNASISNINVTLAGKMQTSSFATSNYAGFIGNLSSSTVNDVQINFSGNLSVGTAAGTGYTGALVGLASGSSSITNCAVTVTGGTLSNSGNATLQNVAIGGTASGATLTKTNTWTLLVSQPTGYTGAGTNNVMRVRENGSAGVAYNESTHIFTFTAVPNDGWTGKFCDANDASISDSTIYAPAANVNSVEYYVCFTKSVTVIAGAGGTVAGAGAYNLRQGKEVTGIVATPDAGYHFINWTKTADAALSSTTDKAISFTMGATGGTITGNFAINTYTLEYNANAGTDQVVIPGSATYQYGQNVVISIAPSRPGYTFLKWNTAADGSGATYNCEQTYQNLTTTDGATVTLYAIWERLTYSVTFHTNGGSVVENQTNVVYGTEITLPATTKAGYNFAMWYDNATCTGNSYPAGTTTRVYATMNLYAKWTPITYTIEYSASGASNVPSSQSVTYTEPSPSILLSSLVPEKSGYIFKGWKAMNGLTSGTVYAKGATISANLANTQGAVITLEAQWDAASYIVAWDLEGGTINGASNIEDSSVTFGGTYTVPSGTPVLSGHVFDGWYSVTYDSNNVMSYVTRIRTGDTVTITDNVIYHVKWAYAKYNISFNANATDATGTMDDVLNCYYETEYQLPAIEFAREGYNFAGWSATADGTGAIYVDSEIVKNLTGANGATVTLYATWTARSYSVTYNKTVTTGVTGSMLPTSITYKTAKALRTNAFKRTGYKFYGWATTKADAEAMSVAYADGASYTMASPAAVTLYAVWAKQTTVTWELCGGTIGGVSTNPTSQVYYGDKYVIPTGEMTKSRNTFRGWYDKPQNEEGGVEITNTTTLLSNSDTTVYAYWEASGSLTAAYYVDHYQENIDGTWFLERSETLVGDLDATVTAEPMSYSGFTYDEGNSLEVTSGTVVDPEETSGTSLRLALYYTRNSYRVLFNSNGGIGTMTPQSFKFAQEQTLKENTFTKVGCSLAGWSTVSGGTTVSYADRGSYTMGTSDITLYAVWNINIYTITFNTMGGSTVEAISQKYGTSITTPTNPIKSGYSFNGWLKDGVAYTIPATMPAESFTLTASWGTVRYDVIFNANGGLGTMANQSIEFTKEVHLTANAFARTGYTFAGWSRVAGGELAYTDGGAFTMSVAENVNIYAMWTANQYTVRFNGNCNDGGSSIDDAVYTYDQTYALPTNTFTKTGSTFAGWSATAGGEKLYNDTDTVSNLAASGMANLYAVWTNIDYTASFDANGATAGTVPADISFIYNQQIVLPAGTDLALVSAENAVSKSFLGWYTEIGGVVTEYAVGDTFTGNASSVTFHARWSANYYDLYQAIALVKGYKDATVMPASTVMDPEYAAGGDVAAELGSDGTYSWVSFNTQAINDAYVVAQSAENQNLPASRQADVDTLKANILNAVANVELLSASFAKEISCTHYSESYLYEAKSEYYPACTVAKKHSFNQLVEACNTIINTPASDSIYTAASVAALDLFLNGNGADQIGFKNTVINQNIKLPAQSLLDTHTDRLAEEFHTTLVLKEADYSGFEYLKNVYLPSLDGVQFKDVPSYYSEDSYLNLIETLQSVPQGLKIIAQSTLDDEYYPAVQEAIDSLVPLEARYDSIFNLILTSIPKGTPGFAYPASTVDSDSYVTWLEWIANSEGLISDNLDVNYLAPRYTPASLQAVYDAINDIDWGLYKFSQNSINGVGNDESYYAKLTAAINDLAVRTYTVTYMLNDGTENVYDRRTVNYDDSIPDPGIPTRLNYTFNGWQTEGGVAVVFTMAITDDTIVYAQWTENVVEEPEIIAHDETSPTVIDNTDNLIFGLSTGVTEADLNSVFLGVEGNGHLEYEYTGSIGTGTKVKLVKNGTNEVVKEYEIVIFGDLNGDGYITASDMTLLKAVIAKTATLTPGTAFFKAVDFNGDGYITATDTTKIKAIISKACAVDQVTGEVE